MANSQDINERLAQPEQEPVDSAEKAGAYMDARLWEFIDMAAAWPEAKPDPRTWSHVMVYAPKPAQEPVKFNCTVVDDAHPEGVPLSQWGKQQKQKPFCYHDGRNIVGKEYAHHCDVFPLYTHPQTQKPLTDEEIWKIKSDFEKYAEIKIPEKPFRHVVRRIEAAHGITGEKK